MQITKDPAKRAFHDALRGVGGVMLIAPPVRFTEGRTPVTSNEYEFVISTGKRLLDDESIKKIARHEIRRLKMHPLRSRARKAVTALKIAVASNPPVDTCEYCAPLPQTRSDAFIILGFATESRSKFASRTDMIRHMSR